MAGRSASLAAGSAANLQPEMRRREQLPDRGNVSASGSGPSGEVVREIDDPHTGDQWMLMRDPVHPEGPGRLVLVAGPGMEPASAGTRDREQPGASCRRADAASHPVIHAGDALIVEEHTAVVEARLEAVALGPAVAGREFSGRD